MNSWQVESFGKPLVQALREVPAPAGTEVVLRIASAVCATATCTCTTAISTWAAGTGSTWRAPCSRRAPWATDRGTGGRRRARDAQGCRSATPRVAYPWIGCAAARCVRRAGAPGHHAAGEGALATVVSRAMVVPHPCYLVDHGAIPDEQACTMPAPD